MAGVVVLVRRCVGAVLLVETSVGDDAVVPAVTVTSVTISEVTFASKVCPTYDDVALCDTDVMLCESVDVTAMVVSSRYVRTGHCVSQTATSIGAHPRDTTSK